MSTAPANTPTSFRLSLSLVEGRLDPHFYQPSTVMLLRRLEDSPHPKKKIGELIQHRCAGDWGEDEDLIDPEEQYQRCLVLRSTEFSDGGNLKIDSGREKYRKILKTKIHRMRVEENDIVIEKSGGSPDQPVGRVACLTSDVLAHGHIAYSNFIEKIKPDKELVEPAYLFHYMRMLYSIGITNRLQSQTNGIRNLMIRDYLKLPVSLPSRKEQKNISTLMRHAYAQKTKLEKQAKDLLESVDALFYEHLGLKPLSKDSHVIQQRIFRVPLKLVAGQVFDPKSYHPDSLALLKLLTESNFPKCRLLDLVTHRSAGDWGEDEEKTSEDYTRCLVIRGTEFDNHFNLRIDNSRAKHRQILTSKLQRMRIEAGDLLVEKSGGSVDQPVGRVARIEQSLLDSQPIAYSNFVEKIKVDSSQISPEYLHLYLRFLHSIGVTNLLQSQTNGIRNLMLKRYLTLPISLPPKTEQTRLVNAVQAILAKSQTLRQQAQDLLVQAQQQTETLILGKLQ